MSEDAIPVRRYGDWVYSVPCAGVNLVDARPIAALRMVDVGLTNTVEVRVPGSDPRGDQWQVFVTTEGVIVVNRPQPVDDSTAREVIVRVPSGRLGGQIKGIGT